MFLFYLFLLVGAALAAKPQHGRCFGEGTKAHEFLSNKYYKCRNQRWVLEECQINYTYDFVSGFCIFTPIPTATTPSFRICIPGSRREDVFDNTRYYQCNYDGTQFIQRFCQPGAVFVQSENQCVALQPTVTWGPPTRPTTRYTFPTTRYTTPPTTTPYYGPCKESGGRAGYKPDIYHCNKFYQCASGIWTQMSCGEGTIWNQEILTCDHNRGQCRPHTHPTIGPPIYLPTGTPVPPGWPNPGNEFKK